MEVERQEAMAADRRKMEDKIEQEKKLKDTLKGQMLELKAREMEVVYLVFKLSFIYTLFNLSQGCNGIVTMFLHK